jgi:creatinine amidohydrolase/Fe(II)-dependent formamide hydrolase-like protein
MSEKPIPAGLLASDQPDLFFEDNTVGRLKKQVWDASDAEIDAILKDYGIPSPSEWGKPGSYVQTTVRWQVEENRKKNDIIFIPVGCTELHGRHLPSASDTLYVSQILEGVRRYTAKRGVPINLALPPLNYGSHPYHHLGMPGTIIVRENVARELLMDVMLGFWNDGFRKQIIINNHGQLWMLESAIQQFQKRFQLPGIFRVIDWHRAVREFFRTKEKGGSSIPIWWICATPSIPRASPTCQKATLTSRWTPLAGPAAGPRERATRPSRSQPRPRVWWARPPRARLRRPSARWRPF